MSEESGMKAVCWYRVKRWKVLVRSTCTGEIIDEHQHYWFRWSAQSSANAKKRAAGTMLDFEVHPA